MPNSAGSVAVWPRLVQAARERTLLTYGQLNEGRRFGSDQAIGPQVLGPIQALCWQQNLPPLTVLVVQKADGAPGSGYRRRLETIRDDLQWVYTHHWTDDVPSIASLDAAMAWWDRMETSQDQEPEPTEKPVEVMRRLRQHRFRQQVLENFSERCAVCAIAEPRLLDAAHIRPWSQFPTGREALANGILLCALHHRAFDAALLHLSREGKVFVHVLLRKQRGWEKTWFTDYHEKSFSKGTIPVELSGLPRWWKLVRDEERLGQIQPRESPAPDE